MDLSVLANQAATHDAYFTGLMNHVPNFFSTYGRNTSSNKYIRHRDGLSAASYKGKKATMRDADEGDDSDSDDEGRDANALFSANNQIPTPSGDSDDEDVGFGAPKSYANPAELKLRLMKLREAQPLPKLSREEITQRKEARKAKDAAAKAKGIKQKSKPSGGHISSSTATAGSDDETPQHQNKKQKTSSKSTNGDETVKLSNVQFSALRQSHQDKVIQDASTMNHSEKAKKTSLSNKQRLEQVEKLQTEVAKLRIEGKGDLADQLEHKTAVSTALSRAMGDNVNDNVRSLKKYLKQDKKLKDKSQKKWKSIKKGEEKQRNERLDSRNLHIRKKIEHKRDSRIARRKKD